MCCNRLFLLFHYRCLAVKTARGPVSDMCVLRPRPRMLAAESESSNDRESAKSGNTIINFDLLNAAADDFQLQHNKLDCQKCFITFDIVSKKGLSCKLSLKCKTDGCGHQKTYPMYLVADEKRRGPKRAAVNKQFAHAVQDSGVGMVGACQMLATMDLAPLTSSNCQKLSKLANDEMTTVNIRSLSQITADRRSDNRALGYSGGGGRCGDFSGQPLQFCPIWRPKEDGPKRHPSSNNRNR